MATIDASIPLGIRPVQIESPLNAMAQFAQVQGAQSQNALMALKMDEIKRAAAEQQQIRTGLAAPDADPVKVLMTAGRPKEAMELAASQRAAEKDRLEMGLKKIGLAGQILSTAKDQPSYDAARTTAQSYGLDVSSMPPQFDPNVVQTKLQQSMSLKEQMEQKWKQMGFDLDVRKAGEAERHNVSTERNAAGQLAVSQGNLGVSQANLGLRKQELAANVSKPFEVTGPDGQAVLVQQDKAGNLTPVAGYAPKGGGKPLPGAALKSITEVRDTANTIDRLATSFKPEYAEKGVMGIGADASLAAKGVMGTDKDAVEWWKNYRKQAELVERHAMFGAALTPGEQGSWRSADISPGMHPDVIARNLKTRQALTARMLDTTRQDLIDAGHSEQRVNAIAGRGPAAGSTGNTAAKAGPAVGTVQAGYRFKGGNPADQNSWEKVR